VAAQGRSAFNVLEGAGTPTPNADADSDNVEAAVRRLAPRAVWKRTCCSQRNMMVSVYCPRQIMKDSLISSLHKAAMDIAVPAYMVEHTMVLDLQAQNR